MDAPVAPVSTYPIEDSAIWHKPDCDTKTVGRVRLRRPNMHDCA